MTIYLLMFGVLFFCWLNTYSFEPQKRVKIAKKYGVIIVLLFVFIAALRGSTVGTDTYSYIRDYTMIIKYSYGKIFSYYTDNPGYFLISKIFADLGVSVQIWFGFIAFLYVGTISKFINKFSKDQMFSYIMFLALGYYSFSLAGLKQVFAMTILLWAFQYLMGKRYIRCFLLILLASIFHLSALIFSCVFFVIIIKKNKGFYWILGMMSIFFVLNYRTIFHTVMLLLNNEHYNEYLQSKSSYSVVTFLVQLTILAVSIIFVKRYNNESPLECRMFTGMVCLGVLFQLFASIVASAFRISMYFSIFAIVLLPNCLSSIQNIKFRRVLKIGAALVFVFFFVYTNRNGGSVVPYRFFWND